MASLTRRLFLRRAAALAPLTVAPAIAAASLPLSTSPSQAPVLTPTEPDAEVRRLAKAFRAAKKAQARTADALAEIEHRIEAAEPDYPPEPRMTKEEWAEHDNATLKMIREQAYGPLMTDFWARCEAWRKTKEAIKTIRSAGRRPAASCGRRDAPTRGQTSPSAGREASSTALALARSTASW